MPGAKGLLEILDAANSVKLNENDVDWLKEMAGSIPFIGGILSLGWSKLDGSWDSQYNNDSDQNQGNGEPEEVTVTGLDTLNQLLGEMINAMTEEKPEVLTFTRQYNTDIRDIRKIREMIRDMTTAINSRSMNLDNLKRKADRIENHLTDYIQGVQKKRMQEAYDASIQEISSEEKQIRNMTKKLSEAEFKKGLIDDLAIQPQNDQNDAKVAEATKDLDITVSADTPNIYTKEIATDEKKTVLE